MPAGSFDSEEHREATWEIRSVREGGHVVRHGLWLSFQSANLEEGYWQAQRPSIYALATAFVVMVLLTFLLGVIADYRVFGFGQTFFRLLPIRICIVAICALTIVQIRRRPARRALEWILLAWSLTGVLFHCLLLSTRPITYVSPMITGSGILMLGYAMLPSSWLLTSLTNIVGFGFYALRILQLVPAADFFSPRIIMWGMLVANVLGCVWAVMNDLGKRRQYVALCVETEARRDLTNLKRAIDTHALVTIADAKGHLLSVNDRFCETSMFSRGELIGWARELLDPGVHSPEFLQALGETLRRGRIWHGELCYRAKDGGTFWADATIVPLVDADGRPEQYINLSTDITQRKAARQALVAAKEAADAANRAKTEFLATMSHEIRTPMNGVLGFASLLSETPLNAEQQHFVSTIRGSGEILLALINGILDLSKIEAGQLTLEEIPFDLPTLVQELVDLMSVRAAEKRLSLSVSVAPTVPRRVLGDPMRLRQVLLNLIGNALKFTEEGEVRVGVDVTPAGAIRFAVRDSGIGLSESARSKLFEKFVQADASTTRRFGGTGLGLAICKHLVEMMGGTIGVESEEGRGSVFSFTVPLASVELAPVVITPVASPIVSPDVVSTAASAPRVLVAEDNATNQFLAKRLLTSLGCSVDVAGNGREAIERWSQLAYDVIFMDCQMPDMDGLEATAEIRRREQADARDFPAGSKPRTHIVACTAGVMTSEREACITAGMDDFVGKPLEKDELRRALIKGLAAHKGAAAA